MSAMPPSVPIHNLNDDVLLYIFTINGDMFADAKALHTTRITSQVCCQWRNLMLNTPFLWARLIDMDAIHSAPTSWWNKLVQRGGVALLWIKAYSGLLLPTYPNSADMSTNLGLFFSMIHSNWSQIQRLVIHGNHPGSGLTRAMVSFPAPQLEEFEAPLRNERALMHVPDLDIEEGPIAQIFAGHAPLLRRFRGTGYVVDRRARWLHHLHLIYLDCTYNIFDALTVLSATHALREVRINDVFNGKLSKSLPNVSLPCLKCLQYEGCPKPCTGLLNHVEIPLDCSLTICIRHCKKCTKSEEMKQHLLHVVKMFRHHTERHLQSHPFNTISLNYMCHQSISFHGKTTNAVECLLNISIPLQRDYGSTQLLMFLNQIGRLDLSRITKLQFHARGSLYPHFQPFLRSLRSLQVISADSETLENLRILQACTIPKTIFPFLKTIELVILLPLPFADQIKVAARFLLLRICTGHPVAILDMATTYLPHNLPLNLILCEDFEGLTIMYKCSQTEGIFEYISGSGRPEKSSDMT